MASWAQRWMCRSDRSVVVICLFAGGGDTAVGEAEQPRGYTPAPSSSSASAW